MQTYYFTSNYQKQSKTMITLHKQIQTLSPIKIQYQNLSKYHHKIVYDLQSLRQDHVIFIYNLYLQSQDLTISSLKTNLQNLLIIANRTEQQRNFILEKLNDLENQCDKVLFDTKNIAQKVQSLSKKLKLEFSQNESNLSYQEELQNIYNSLKCHIQALETLNNDLKLQQDHIHDEIIKIQAESNEQKQKNQQLTSQVNQCKSKIVFFNLKNDDMININNKLSHQINLKQEQFNSVNKLSRQLKQHVIELASDCQKLKNQIQYKNNLLSAEKIVQIQLENHQQSLSSAIQSLSEEKAKILDGNLILQSEVIELSQNKKASLKFKDNAQQHLIELKRQNEVLLHKMQQCCIQDRQIETLLLKKMSSLQAFSRRLNKKYQIDCQNITNNVFKQKSTIFNERSLNIYLSHRIGQKSQKMNNTRTSSKSPWLKENFA